MVAYMSHVWMTRVVQGVVQIGIIMNFGPHDER